MMNSQNQKKILQPAWHFVFAHGTFPLLKIWRPLLVRAGMSWT